MANNSIPSIEPIKLLASVIQTEMELPDGAVMLGLENFPIPENPGLYIALTYGVEQVVGSVNQNSINGQGGYEEVQSVSMLHQIEVDIMSFDSSARTRKEEVIMALKSYNAEQLMEKNQMRIGSTPGSFTRITSLEPSKQLNRFSITISVYALHQKTLETTYYDTLQTVQLVEDE